MFPGSRGSSEIRSRCSNQTFPAAPTREGAPADQGVCGWRGIEGVWQALNLSEEMLSDPETIPPKGFRRSKARVVLLLAGFLGSTLIPGNAAPAGSQVGGGVDR